jgi:hypothetical protein
MEKDNYWCFDGLIVSLCVINHYNRKEKKLFQVLCKSTMQAVASYLSTQRRHSDMNRNPRGITI